MLSLTTILSIVSLTTINTKGAPNPMDWTYPEPTGRYWDFDNDTLIAWEVTTQHGTTKYIYNITKMGYLENLTSLEIDWYSVVLDEMYYNWSLDEIIPYNDPINHPKVNASMLNYTQDSGYMLPFNFELFEPNSPFANPFIPKNWSDELDLHWCAERLATSFYVHFLNDTKEPPVNPQITVSDNSIRIHNDTVGSFINMTYLANGTLSYADMYLWLGEGFQSITFTRTWDFLPHGIDNYWHFGGDNAIGWTYEGFFGTDLNFIYNISKIGDLGAATYPIDNTTLYDGVYLKQMYWNTTLNQLMEYTNLTENLPVNASIINYEKGIMYPYNIFIGAFGPVGNLFIPKNGSNDLDLHWCAKALAGVYGYFLGGIEEIIVTTNPNTPWFANNTGGTYVELTYYDNGTLQSGRINGYFDETLMQINISRLFNFNPYDEIGEWAVEIDDILYMGYIGDQMRIVILDIINTTINFHGMLNIPVQQVLATISTWNTTTEGWDLFLDEVAIGIATENSPMLITEQGMIPLLVPIGTSGEEMADYWKSLASMTPSFDEVHYGDTWFKLYNSSTGGYIFFEYYPNGMLKYAYAYDLIFMDDDVFENMVLYHKNATVLPSGIHQLTINVVADIDFSITVDLGLKADTLVTTSAFSRNPFNITLDNGQLYIDIMINASLNLDDTLESPINITITYDNTKWENLKVMWFNESGDGGNGSWEEISFLILGDGILLISVNHTSVFSLTATEKPQDDEPDPVPEDPVPEDPVPEDPVPEAAIPFGYSYLLFMGISICALVFYYKKRNL